MAGKAAEMIGGIDLDMAVEDNLDFRKSDAVGIAVGFGTKGNKVLSQCKVGTDLHIPVGAVVVIGMMGTFDHTLGLILGGTHEHLA
eukprot:gene1808-biopygen3872